ncbi:hypothetical protein EDD85DRAFT_962531 [Armillaria nabsnona]|nr:hypothetical protein EDD85DRAFT_962531 [Armillaria nabsnona]
MPALPTPPPASLSDLMWPIPVRRLTSSKFKVNSGASVTKSSACSSFLGLQETGACLEAWSTPSPSDSDSSSSLKSSFSLSFSLATLLLSSLSLNAAGIDLSTQNIITQPSNAGLLAVDASSHPNIIPQGAGSNAPTQDNESEQGQGAPVGNAFKVAVTKLMAGNDNVPVPPTHTASNREANPPPYIYQEPKILFIFDDITGDWDPYPVILLPRPQCSAPTEQEVCHSSHPHASPDGCDATYLATAQGSKSKKDKKGKNKGPGTTAPHKWTCHEDNNNETADRPSSKKTKVKDVMVVSDDEHSYFLFLPQLSIAVTKVICKRGPGPAKPPPVTLGVSSKGFGEKVPSSAKVVKNGIKTIGVLAINKDFGKFVEVDKAYWNKEVAPFMGEQYTEGCNIAGTWACSLPCKVNGVSALNPIDYYHPKSYETLNMFLAALDTLRQHADSIKDILLNYLSSINVLAHVAGLHLQASHIHYDEDANAAGDDNEAPDDVAEGVAGPPRKGSTSRIGLWYWIPCHLLLLSFGGLALLYF